MSILGIVVYFVNFMYCFFFILAPQNFIFVGFGYTLSATLSLAIFSVLYGRISLGKFNI